MKTILVTLGLLWSSLTFADQLAYISKAEADEAVEMIQKMKSIYLFCGCCSLVEPIKVKPTKVYAEYTNYEDYYEVIIEYIDDQGNTVTDHLDLAYVWKKKLFGYKTIGQLMGLEHDYCVKPNDWDNPKHIEKDI